MRDQGFCKKGEILHQNSAKFLAHLMVTAWAATTIASPLFGRRSFPVYDFRPWLHVGKGKGKGTRL